MGTLRSDRRLFLNADRSRICEEGDPDAAVLLAGRAGLISVDDVARYELAMKNRKIVYPGMGKPEKAAPVEEPEVEEPEEEPEEWDMGISPARYIAMYEDSDNPEVQEQVGLARRVMAREEE